MSNNAMTQPSRPLNKDRLYMVPREEAIRSAHLALDTLQRLDPEEMMAGMAVLFSAVCSRCQVDAHDMHTMGTRILRPQPFHDKGNKAIQSLRDFAGLRIAGQDVVVA